MKKGRKIQHLCIGGPLHNVVLLLYRPGTLVFTLHGQKGFYNTNMEWRKVK